VRLAAVPVLVASLGVAVAAQPAAAPEAGEALTRQVEQYLSSLGRSEQYPYDVVVGIAAEWDQILAGKGGDPREFIPDTLEELEPRLADARRALEAGRAATAAAQLHDLLQEAPPDPYLAAYVRLFLGQALMDLSRAQDARDILAPLAEEDRIPHTPEALLELARAAEKEGLGATAEQAYSRILEEHPDAPAPILSAARAGLNRAQEAVAGPLGEVAGLMKDSEDLLRAEQSGEPTQQTQEEIVSLLDELIRKAEEQESGGGSASSASQSSSPAQSSALPGGSAPGEVPPGPGEGASPADAWGNLPDRQREEILQVLRERFPARYRELLEQYYRDLQSPEK